MKDLTIIRLPVDASADAALMTDVAVLVNRVYAVAEQGLWLAGAERTSADEISRLTLAGEIAVARLEGRLVGCVRVRHLDEVTGEFGMLAADPDHRGIGIGRELVHFAEQGCKNAGLAVMQLEVLFPREWSHPSKEFLATWYTRIGYRKVRTGVIDESYPHLAPLLATPCAFVVYNKDLSHC
ncbi:GNAT family N-acetyltransferase [Microbispora bryophytorum]|uniref:GNAT family N-acetyltransferase n=1 Tax=Microbispora bryophytorum TaxID=1460882 RepID=UPI0033C3F9A1